LKLHHFKVGPIRTNCYLVEDEGTKKALVIDAGGETDKILACLKKNGLTLELIVATHGHFDHLEGVRQLKERTSARFLLHRADLFGLKTAGAPQPDGFLKDRSNVKCGILNFEIIHTPGHSPGGICLYNEKEKALFSGDTLFLGTYGRVDLPGSDEPAMIKSLKRLLALPPETKVYPGHGNPTTIAAEQKVIATAW
jgi:glyoxylase-like metal-dependent hydrolase (beta-lactamase superfamily II)